MKHITNTVCIILRKYKPTVTVAASIHLRFVSVEQQKPTFGKFSFAQNFTVKSVEDVFHSFDSLNAFPCYCCLENICNSTCWQINYHAVTLSRPKKTTKSKLNATSQFWKLIKLYTLTPDGLCVVFFENRVNNVLKLGIAAVQFSSSWWRTGSKLVLIPVSASTKNDRRMFLSRATYGALTMYFIVK